MSFVPSFRGRRHTEQTKQRIRESVSKNCGRGLSYEERYGPLVASYLKELRRLHAINQPRDNKFSFAGRHHTDASKQLISVSLRTRRKQSHAKLGTSGK
jgi:NUMOD3 motif